MSDNLLPEAAFETARDIRASRPTRLVFLLCLLAACRSAADLTGHATVIDGDTLEVADTRIRLYGIDAPEDDQTCELGGVNWLCGKRARKALDELVRGWPVSCTEMAWGYDPIVAVCLAGGRDVNAAMVSSGMALAYDEHADDYAEEEAAAKAARRGLWTSRFVPPEEWRKTQR